MNGDAQDPKKEVKRLSSMKPKTRRRRRRFGQAKEKKSRTISKKDDSGKFMKIKKR